LIVKRILKATIIRFLPEGKVKFFLMSGIMKILNHVPIEFIVKPGYTVLLVGFHRLDSVINWSYEVGKEGKVVVIEAVPQYINNLRINLEHHLKWPFQNITYISKGVDSVRGKKHIQIGKVAGYNKILEQNIDDFLSNQDYCGSLEIATDTIDHIIEENGISQINHIEMTISGMEYEALKGMKDTIKKDGLTIQIRSLHIKNGKLIYPQVIKFLKNNGMRVVTSGQIKKFMGRQIYASRA
jgi:FkbM family methyltransferase